eukprot:2815398-Prymnesium_polylepis.1
MTWSEAVLAALLCDRRRPIPGVRAEGVRSGVGEEEGTAFVRMRGQLASLARGAAHLDLGLD